VAVEVGVHVDVFVTVSVGVLVNVLVGVDVKVFVGVRVLVGVGVRVGVGVFGARILAEKTLLILKENNNNAVNNKPRIFMIGFVFWFMKFLQDYANSEMDVYLNSC